MLAAQAGPYLCARAAAARAELATPNGSQLSEWTHPTRNPPHQGTLASRHWDYGNTGGPLCDALEQFQEAPPWTARPCDCGSGLAFRDCCMEREDTWAEALRR